MSLSERYLRYGRVSALSLLILGALSCSRDPIGAGDGQELGKEPSSKIVGQRYDSETLSTHLAQSARRAHSYADAASSAKERTLAANQMTQAFDDSSDRVTPASLAVRQDLAARAANLQLALGKASEARRLARAGLALTSEASVLRGNLLMSLAEIEEVGGRHEEKRAALVEALQVNEQLMESELSEP